MSAGAEIAKLESEDEKHFQKLDSKLDKIDSEVAIFIKNQKVAKMSDSPPLWNTQDIKEQQDFQEFQNQSFQSRLNSLKTSMKHITSQSVSQEMSNRKRGLNFKEENPVPQSSLFKKLKNIQKEQR